MQATLPRLKSMTWSMESRNSIPGNRLSVITLKASILYHRPFLLKLFVEEENFFPMHCITSHGRT
ncbi:Protein FAR1-RELATED SEQUENCE 3 [Dendrobium catenatum]|uniref:Protein FAR1-RELATED SEQUENCE 3 n=1 Tax=Dendrobium catenatum TaxID=906689 RepID=A0A2I0VCY7_9ASPA|nr:Protein FAR1-RELATED SEQUENCE 3 [Dendrobium catenatum]